MKKCRQIFLVLSFLAGSAFSSSAAGRGDSFFHYGLEWGYTSTIIHLYHNNYIAEEGYRVDKNAMEWCYNSNGHFYANAGLNYNGRHSSSICIGYIGIKQERHVLPLTFRQTFFFNSYDSDGALCFADAGLCIHEKERNTFIGRAGTGWRMALSTHCSIDFLLSFQISYDHPKVIDNEQEVEKEHLRRNDSTYGGVNFGIAVNF